MSKKERIEKLEAALREIYLMSAVDGKSLSDAIYIAARALGPNRV